MYLIFIKDFDLWMKMYGIQTVSKLQYITESPHMMTRLRSMMDFVNHNDMDSIGAMYGDNKDILDQNYNFLVSGDFFEYNMNRIDQYVQKI